MSEYFVKEIIDANTVRVSPPWSYYDKRSGETFKGDVVTIAGLNVHGDNRYMLQSLNRILLNQDVDLKRPQLVRYENDHVRLACIVMLHETDITYFYPEVPYLVD